MKKVLERERLNSIDKQKGIAKIKTDVRRFTNLSVKMDRIKHLDKCRRMIAFNTLKTWHNRIKDKSKRRSSLLELKTG